MSLWQKEFWLTYWVAIRRCRKDSRSRQIVIRTTVRLLILPLYFCILGITLAQSGDSLWIIVFDCLILSCAFLIVMAFRKSHQREDALLRLSPTTKRQVIDDELIPKDVKQHLTNDAVIKAALLARGLSESFLKTKELPDNISIETRRNLIESLRKHNLWDKLDVEERDLLHIADGHWTWEQIHLLASWCEQLRLLRWVLGLDARIVPLALFPKPDASLVTEIINKGGALFASKTVLATWDIRLERDIARTYFLRCLAEQQSRGLFGGPPEFVQWAQNVQAELASPSQDILVRAKAISELDTDDLAYLRAIAITRYEYSNSLLSKLAGMGLVG